MIITASPKARASCLATLLSWALPAAALAASPADPRPDTASPVLEFVFEELVLLAPDNKVGQTPWGQRNIVPITGGTFEGPHIKGKVLAGGWDWQLLAAGGCASLQADYMIQADDGTIINVVNTGTMCKRADGQVERALTTPRFEAPIGKHDWLNGGAFVGTLEGTQVGGQAAVRIRFYKAR